MINYSTPSSKTYIIEFTPGVHYVRIIFGVGVQKLIYSQVFSSVLRAWEITAEPAVDSLEIIGASPTELHTFTTEAPENNHYSLERLIYAIIRKRTLLMHRHHCYPLPASPNRDIIELEAFILFPMTPCYPSYTPEYFFRRFFTSWVKYTHPSWILLFAITT